MMKGMNEKKIQDLIESKYSLRRQLKGRLERQSRFNKDCYKGYQWFKSQDTDFSTADTGRDFDNNFEPSIVVNHILPLVTQRIATMTKTKPIITTVPKTSDMDDIDKAQSTDMCAEYAWQKFNIVRKLVHVLLDADTGCGKSFWKIIWDKNLGEEREDVVDIKEGVDEFGMPTQKPIMGKFRIGDVAVIPVNGTNIITDPIAESDEELSWMLHFYEKPLKQVAYIHNIADKDLTPDDTLNNSLDIRLHSNSNRIVGTAESDRSVVVKELYYAPDNDFPKGLYAKFAGGKLLEYEEMSKEKWPFVPFQMQENTDSYWGEAITTHIAPINQELNDVRSHMMAYQKMMVYGYWVNPPESGVDDDELENINGVILHPQSQNKEMHPYRIEPPAFPNGLFNMADSYVSDMESIASIHPASRGQNPEGNRSAQGLLYMQETDQMALGPAAIMLEESLTLAIKKILELMKEHYDDTRMISVVGQNGIPKIQAFKKDRIVLDDLRATLFSSLPRSRAGQMQQLMELMDRQVFTPEQLPKVLDAFGIGSLANITDENKLIEEEAKREFWDLLNSDKLPKTYEFQDHAGHGKGHTMSMMNYQAKQMWDVEFGQNGGDQQQAIAPAQQLENGQVIPEHVQTYGEIMMNHYHAHQQIQQSLMMQQVQIQAQMQLQAQQITQGPAMQAQAQQAEQMKGEAAAQEQKMVEQKMQDKLMDAAMQEHSAQRGEEQNTKSQLLAEALARSRPKEEKK
jgi:hypothetical protein